MKFKLALGIHNHQPVGNFQSVFEEAHDRCYKPFLELMKKHPRIRFSLHQSGILWDWQKENRPEFFRLVQTMVDSGQMELLTGAFYEPILSSIPERDKVGQLGMLTEYLKHHFGVDPDGMWLAERVWEPHLPKSIASAGVRFLPLDDTHFKYAGLRDEQLFGTYVTEEEGDKVVLLPILKRLRYLIPFGKPEKAIEFLAHAAREHPGGLAVYADDGEKFGSWPKTYKHIYEDGWLEQFLTLLESNADWLDVISLGEAVRTTKSLGRVYLPTASYSEMLHWALPADSFVDYEDFEDKLKDLKLFDDYGRFVRGGHWRGFLAKYPESNLMHKKMLAVSDLYAEVAAMPGVDAKKLAHARDLLYAGQCNCPYWHGVFGGLYLPHLRQAIYKKLIEADGILRRLADRTAYYQTVDWDRDGFDDIVVGGSDLSMVLCPARGGQMVEFDIHGSNVNIADCLTRRREGYHQKLLKAQAESGDDETKSIHDVVVTKEKGLEKLLVNDWYLRRSLSDHFLGEGTSLDDFLTGQYYELGDFVLEPFASDISEKKNAFVVTLSRDGHVWRGDFHCPVRIQKTITFPKHGYVVTVDYRLVQTGLEALKVNFGVEFDFNLLAPDADDRYAVIDGARPPESHLAAAAETSRASTIAYADEWQKIGIGIESDQPGKLWRMPIHTVSLSEGGFEKVFQGNCTIFIFENTLRQNEAAEISFKIFAGPLERMNMPAQEKKVTADRV